MNPPHDPPQTRPTKYRRLQIAAVILTIFGTGIFVYLIYSVGVSEIVDGIGRFGVVGFAVILALYFGRIVARSYAWKLSVHEPDRLTLRDTIPAVLIGEALSSTIPLGILISGTAKAVAVRHRLPMVAGLSSVATENLFYSLITSVVLILGAVVLLRGFAVDASIIWTINALIVVVSLLVLLGLLMVIRQWHFASAISEWLYAKGWLHSILENGRREVRRFEDLIYGFYRRYPRRFVPICLLEAAFHVFAVLETWFILVRISETSATVMTAFLLESVSRLVTIVFKLVPFMIGVDEAGSNFVGETVGLALGVGVTLAIIRKARILVWTLVGILLIVKRGLRFADISRDDLGTQES